MTTNYQILTDSSCDLPASLARTLGIFYAPLRVQFQGAEYENFLDGDPRSRLEMKAFYKTLRTGTPTSTTASILRAGAPSWPLFWPRGKTF